MPAAPSPPALTPADARAVPTWRAAYSDRTAALMARLAELAYVADRPTLASRLEGGGFNLAAVFVWSGVLAYLAVNPLEFAVLAFRGTANAADWGIDLDAALGPMPGRPGIRSHRGFTRAFGLQQERILAGVNAAVPNDLGLYITGHSLGGALAQLAASALERDNLAACYTFGSPRVATAGFDLVVKCPHYRLVNHWDLVPGVPPASPGGYRHSGDPRLLAGPKPLAALRRDHAWPAWAWAQLRALAGWLVTRDLYDVDDHMIWNYRAQLEAIAARRTG